MTDTSKGDKMSPEVDYGQTAAVHEGVRTGRPASVEELRAAGPGAAGCLQSKPRSSWLLEIAEIQAQAEDATGALQSAKCSDDDSPKARTSVAIAVAFQDAGDAKAVEEAR